MTFGAARRASESGGEGRPVAAAIAPSSTAMGATKWQSPQNCMMTGGRSGVQSTASGSVASIAGVISTTAVRSRVFCGVTGA